MNDPRAALLVLTDIDAEYENDFNHWYDDEHVPERVAVPGVRAAHRFVRADIPAPSAPTGPTQLILPPKYLVIYDLDHSDVVRGDAWMSLSGVVTPLWERVTPHMRNTIRGGYEHLRSFRHE